MSQPSALAVPAPGRQSLWINTPLWDLSFISLSAVVVALPFTVYFLPQWFGVDAEVSRNVVNGVIALLVGGPHMYATYTRTVLDPGFRAKRRAVVASSSLIPVAVIYFGVTQFIFLLTFFFFVASVHVLEQIRYLVDVYNKRVTKPLPTWSRIVDYAVVMLALYPHAVEKLVADKFTIGTNVLLFPAFLKHDWVTYLVYALFALAAGIYVIKTIIEFARGEGHLPKTILIVLTATIAFFLPTFPNLDVAFQGFNTWHSVQYLGFTWYANTLRRRTGAPMSPLVGRISEGHSAWKYYGFNIACTSMTVVVILAAWALTGFNAQYLDQCYYLPVLSVLLTHYFHDHILFKDTDALNVVTAPAKG